MCGRILGLETEYASHARRIGGTPYPRNVALRRLMRSASRSLPNLPGLHSSGLFLQNGARLYLDVGNHLEYCTPECSDPADLVRHVAAGERILAELADQVAAETAGLEGVDFYKCNVNYVGKAATWGCHESLLNRAKPRLVETLLIPHLVSRIIYTGAGGFDARFPGIGFLLSPRVSHLTRVISTCSTSKRGIFHRKGYPRRKGTRGRVHIICGESVSSHRAAWLKAGTTALVVALAEGGLAPERRTRPRSPLGAMRTFARDADCNARIAGVTGRRLTAIEIQRTYLELAERHLGAPFMPPWAEEVCREWRRTLDSLERRPEALDATLDWRIKLALFRTHARSRGLPWEKVEAWNRVLGSLRPALPKRYRSGTPLAPDLVLSPASPIAGEVRSVTPLLLGSGLTWDGLVPFLRLREELFEIDVRFGQLGEEGIFRRLDAAGVLDHGAPGVENIDDAKERPPASTRARVRGDSVRRYSGGEGDYRCEWSGVWNLKSSSCLKLEDAFQTEAEWVKPSPGRSALPPVPAPSQPGNLAAHALSILADAQREQSPSELLRLNRQSCGSD